ncbi:MAG: zinc-dependent metalloprotease [Bacteroidetes bacterium]|nr:zinc-dependent metalloprotease [Bacteroidota bacterium]
MQKILLTLLLSAAAIGGRAQAPSVPITDGFDDMMERARSFNPNYKQDIARLNQEIEQKGRLLMTDNAAQKTTAIKEVPIIFHVVLNSSQLAQIGGEAGVIERINSQIDALNADYNAANADSATIPPAFKTFYANVGIHFALAHKDPNGNYTPGYEFITTTQSSFAVNGGTIGSGFACSDAKFSTTGGAEAWDTKKYINVWVINITPFGVGGVGTPPPYAAYGGEVAFPWNEQGIAIAYFALGKQTSSSQYFVPAAKAGRTLVHEMGHFFNLFHPFGLSTFDNSDCTDDDGVGDTPKEAGPTQSKCPAFPLLDTCSNTFPGVMFMNHMDYSADTCRTMFTTQQAARINVELANGGYRQSLLDDPGIIYNYPTTITTISNQSSFRIFPNPASGNCVLWFAADSHPKEATLLNAMGQAVKVFKLDETTQLQHLDISDIARGAYSLQCRFDNTAATQRLMIY